MHIDIDFDVYKALTALRRSEDHSYNDVLRELLGLPVGTSSEPQLTGIGGAAGRLLGGRYLSNGTELRATYKGRLYNASIRGGELVDEAGTMHTSASAAARSITKNTVNGLAFWEAKRPGDIHFQKLLALPKSPK
ncbi:MAG TPA: hypothetical protein VFW35_06605 [Sphingomicrobium sp.]|nr:hypothetical protein [Sphingomicrobium sp.]